MSRRSSFTLIELLIVVAIISILAAIAVPNFLESQTRAKVARVRADARTAISALEAYRVDENAYPSAEINGTLRWFHWLTTPVSYLSHKQLRDPFRPPGPGRDISEIETLRYYGFNGQGVLNAVSGVGTIISPRTGPDETLRILWYAMFSHGPDRVRNNLTVGSVTGTFVKTEVIRDLDCFIHYVYDASNGTTSLGEILRSGGEFGGPTAPIARFMLSSP
ncbi:prepilin-type N-terminal cleavage/methylation domain-containing protein [Candidatus Sumerlaeota bacterium]|nr:prepilin-type N-terminal cleavage/methylation domain-containing protein [Candidatus Sumerlaeota bacterium]